MKKSKEKSQNRIGGRHITKTITEKSRQIPVVAEPDVLVCGGGPAGFVAAVAAARNGADTLLVERYGHLGGMATGGHVIFIDMMANNVDQVTFGIAQEVIERATRYGGVAWRAGMLNPLIDAEIHKFVAQELVEGAPAKIRFHSWVVDTVMEGNTVKGIMTESKSGRQAILAKVVIDATGDGDIAAFASAEYEEGTLPITLMCRVGAVDIEAAQQWQRDNPDMYKRMLDQLYRTKVLVQLPASARIGTGWAPTTRENVVYCHWASFMDLSATKVEDLTYCEIEGRKRIMGAVEFFSKNVPGWEKAYVVDTAPQIGTRLSRMIKGAYTLTIDDIREETSFADNIGTCPEYPDHHYQIPYRTLVPTRIDNLLVAGRCISTDTEAQIRTRIIAPCMTTGQAVGTAAAIAAKQNIKPRNFIKSFSPLREALLRQNVNLGASMDIKQQTDYKLSL